MRVERSNRAQFGLATKCTRAFTSSLKPYLQPFRSESGRESRWQSFTDSFMWGQPPSGFVLVGLIELKPAELGSADSRSRLSPHKPPCLRLFTAGNCLIFRSMMRGIL